MSTEHEPSPSFKTRRLGQMPEPSPAVVSAHGTGDSRWRALRAIEGAMASGRHRSLVQLSPGGGAGWVGGALVDRWVRFAGARRILFLLAGRGPAAVMQRRLECFEGEDGSPFGELYQTELWTEAADRQILDGSTRVLISIPAVLDELINVAESGDWPASTFDAVILMGGRESSISCCRSLARHFDAPWVGLVPGPSKAVLEFFEHHLLMEYHHHQAVADGLKVDLDMFHPRLTPERDWRLEQRPVVDGGDWRHRIRAARWQSPGGRTAQGVRMSQDALRTFVAFLRDGGLSQLFPGRDHLPKTLIYAADNDHARQVVDVFVDQLGLDQGFCEYLPRSVDADGSGLVKSFQEHYLPRLAVVDGGAGGLRVPVVELLMVLAPMPEPAEAESWLGWAGQAVSSAALRAVTPDADAKTHLRVLDLAGTLESRRQEIGSLVQSPSLGLAKVLELLAQGKTDSVLIHTLVGRLVRLAQRVDVDAHGRLAQAAGGQSLWSITRALVDALDVDRQLAWAQAHAALKEDDLPDDGEMAAAAQHLIRAAAEPLVEESGLVELLMGFA